MVRTIRNIIGCILLIGLAGCSSKSGDDGSERMLTVSIEPLRQITETLVGDEYVVETILDKGANPESFDPSMKKMTIAERSEAFFSLNAFTFETKLTNSTVGKTKSVDVSKGIKRVYGTHTHGNGEECRHEADPHTWTSAKNSIIIAKNIAETLSEINPQRSEVYNQRLDSLTKAIQSLDNKIVAKLDSLSTRSFAVWHPSLSYFAKDYGLNQISVGSENKEVSPLRLKEIIENAKDAGIRVFFLQREFDSRQVKTISESIGARMVSIDPLAYDWMGELEYIANELEKE